MRASFVSDMFELFVFADDNTTNKSEDGVVAEEKVPAQVRVIGFGPRTPTVCEMYWKFVTSWKTKQCFLFGFTWLK